MKRFTSLINIIIIFMLFGTAAANKGATLELVNNTDHIYIFNIQWIDHPYLNQTFGRPWSLAMGEVEPGKTWKLDDYNYSPGLYKVECYPARIRPDDPLYKLREEAKFTIKPHIRSVIITTLIVEDTLEIWLIFGHGL